ncbi:hypothetical protein L6164_022918 [Bauhinia variegata]|uniref:Uncharacterized protein n=1 Tax=Bauhinia variegata TaxID=167791 RepID=A0ACB9MGX2_BAUVA|nr:hypothetical protein L6164_022918 [Bauhinia variegata]
MPLFLSDEEFSRCRNDAAVVSEKADAYIRGLLNELETVKAKADASDINAEQNCSLIEQKYISLTAEFSKLENQVTELQSALDQRLTELSEVQSQKHQILIQFVEKDGEIERLKNEVGELHKSKRQLIELVEQKDLELTEKNATIKSYLDKIVDLSENAALKEARMSEIEAELARSRADCTLLLQEKEIIERQNAWLNDELTAKVNSFIELRRKHTDLEADMSSKLAEVERQLSECSKSLQWNKDRVRELEMKLKSMHEELISAKDAAAANEAQLSSELSTVNKLNELYKKSSEEWSRKAGELEGVVKAMESHLRQVEDDYKVRLEKEVSTRKQVEKEASDLKEKLEKQEAEIETSKKTNELALLPPSSFTTEPLSATENDDTIEENRLLVPKTPFGVSGTALAASLLRDGWSLTKMYAKYQEAVDALQHEQLNRKQSEAILQRVLYDLEEKAEAIIDERVEHEKMVEAYSVMNQKLQSSLTEKSNLEKTVQELKADLRRQERDRNLAQKEIGDLQKQVTALLKECRDIQLQGGSIRDDAVNDTANIAFGTSMEFEPEKIISERLLTFNDINGLVEQNVQLRGLVRSLSEQIENKEMDFKVKLEIVLKKHNEEAASKVAAVLQRAEEQGRMIESLHTSVAMYKRLYEEEHNLQLSHAHSSEVPTDVAEGGRNNLKPSTESSQEAAKNALEKAAERMRCLEEDLAKSRTEVILLRSERDKLALEASFSRERLDSFVKEFDHQKAEANGILARNVEFSQLIIDYQRKLRESPESLHAAEEISRKLSMELSVLKNEKEVILNAEKRASDEVRRLSERVHRLQASLDTIHSAEEVREEARAAERRKQEEYIKKLEREWVEAKKELQEERANVRTSTVDHDQTIKSSMRQVEEMGKELANALHAVAVAESRAAVAESKLSGLQRNMSTKNDKHVEMDGASGSSTLSSDEVLGELSTAKEEIRKLKEELQDNKAHMLQYKSIAEVNEDALKQMELTHGKFKSEADNTRKALEAELYLLREKVSELENESSLKSEEVACAAAGKEEALTSAMAEITSLKEDILAKSSQISAMEVQISCLKEDLDKEHQRWRAAQTNYERQVILQSETIQELKKTSQALSLLQEEASELRKLSDTQKIENNELNAKWKEEKAVLEKNKNDAEKKYNEINEQNKILHSRLEVLHIQLAERERSAGFSSGSIGANTSNDAGLQNVINYLRRSKDIAETEISLLKQEKLRLQTQLESALKAAESAHVSLEAERAKSKSVLFSEEEFKSLQLQVREMNLLRESNMQLREENKHNFKECQRLHEIAQKASAETQNLENLLRERDIKLEGRKSEIEALKTEKDHLDQKVSELLERFKNVDVEDYDRMKILVRDMQDKLKEKDTQMEEISKILSEKNNSVAHLEQDLSNCRSELIEREKRINELLQVEANLKQEGDKHRKLFAPYKKRSEILAKDKDELVKENQQLSKQLEEFKQVKRSTSDTTGEQTTKDEKDTRIQTLEKHLIGLREELKKEKEDNRTEKARRQKTEKAIKDAYNNVEQEKTKFMHELEKHKEALKRLSDEVERLKLAIGNLPEGTNVVQLLSGSNLDDLATTYALAVETFEREAHSVSCELGIRGNVGDTTSTADALAAVTAPPAPAQAPTIASSMAPVASSLPPKAAEESEKRVAIPKTNIETRRTGRKLIRPRLTKPGEAQGDVEMSEAEVPQSGSKHEPSSDTETQGNLPSSQPLARKRVAPTSTSELREESVAPGETGSDAAAPMLKKSKGSDSPQDGAKGQPAVTPEFTGRQQAIEELFGASDLPQGLNEEVIEAQNEAGETVFGRTEESKDQHLDGISKEDSQGDKTSISEENLDRPVETQQMPEDMQKDRDEPDNQQLTSEFGNEREEGELAPEAVDLDGSGDVSNMAENQESMEAQSEPAATPEPSPARGDDEALEAGEIHSPELSNDDKNDEGNTVEEAADGSDNPNDVSNPVAVESDQVADPAPVASEITSTSTAAETDSLKLGFPVSKQGTSGVTSETEEVKQASPIKQDQVADPAPVANEGTSTSTAAETNSSKVALPVSKQGTSGVTSETEEVKLASPIKQDQVADPAPFASESTPTSTAAEASSSKPVSKQGTSGVTSEPGEIKQASAISSTSTTINLSERARERAFLRQRAVVERGRGRGAPRGRVGRGRGRRQPSDSA